MLDSNTVDNVSNLITYNTYYGLFITYVFPILLILLICLVVGYLASINSKLKKLLITDDEDKKLQI